MSGNHIIYIIKIESEYFAINDLRLNHTKLSTNDVKRAIRLKMLYGMEQIPLEVSVNNISSKWLYKIGVSGILTFLYYSFFFFWFNTF